MAKYNNTILKVDGITFHSKKEWKRYVELSTLEKAKQISDLKTQVAFTIIPKLKESTGKAIRETKYIADFTYIENGNLVVEDVKGVRTQAYILKRKLMKHVHGIDIHEI